MMSLPVTFLTSILIQYSLCTLIVDPNGYQYMETLLPNDEYISYPAVNPLTYQPYQPATNILEVPQVPEQRNIRQSPPSPPTVPTDTSQITKNLNSEINEIIASLNQLTENRMTEHQEESRAAERADDYGLYHRASYGYPPSPYVPWSPSYGPQPHKHEHSAKLSLLKPDLLVKPIATKAAGKISGLIELILALLTGSGTNDLELKGFKDIVINGIVKPLLTAKGGLKSLISKLSIPMISLLLINLEVLITIWWLWEEDCPKPAYHPPAPVYGYSPKPSYHVPAPSYPPSYNYNSYK